MAGSDLPAQGKLPVLIVGAGVTGLLIAHGLKKAGISFRIFEYEASSDQYRPREWSMAIHWSLPLLESLLPDDLIPRLKEPQNDPFFDHKADDVMRIYNGETGDVLKEMPIGKSIRVSRRKLRAFCSQGIDVELSDLSYSPDGTGVEASFVNGEKVLGSLIIGSDGPRSKVRDLLLGPDQAATTPLEVVHVNVVVNYGDAEKAKFVRSSHPVFSFTIHPNGVMAFLSIQDVPDPDKPETWRFQVVTSWMGRPDSTLDNVGRLAQVKAKAKDLADPFRSAVLWIPDDTKVTYNSIGYWVTKPWENHGGRVTLAGDAAHPMPPHRGQGLNHAICDAANLVEALANVQRGDVAREDAITTYDREVVRRGADEVTSSKHTALAMFNWDVFMESPMIKMALKKAELDK
ncbi:MAG: hypothetical protein M1833_006189 [Piccolia ochrophora]|nr:MAG: hypothetical protein M1833_006189 [Piccolia ochrophora]